MASDEVENGEAAKEDRRAHEHVDDVTGQVKTSEDETTTKTPHIPPRTPLKGECTPQASVAIDASACEPDDTKTTWDQGYQSTTTRVHETCRTTTQPRWIRRQPSRIVGGPWRHDE